jgi:hypothetical protein
MLRLVRGHHGISTSAFKTWSNICDHRLQRIPTETYEMSGKVATSLGTDAQIFSLQCGGRSCRSSLFSEALPLPSATSATLVLHSAGVYILPTQKAYSSTLTWVVATSTILMQASAYERDSSGSSRAISRQRQSGATDTNGAKAAAATAAALGETAPAAATAATSEIRETAAATAAAANGAAEAVAPRGSRRRFARLQQRLRRGLLTGL